MPAAFLGIISQYGNNTLRLFFRFRLNLQRFNILFIHLVANINKYQQNNQSHGNNKNFFCYHNYLNLEINN